MPEDRERVIINGKTIEWYKDGATYHVTWDGRGPTDNNHHPCATLEEAKQYFADWSNFAKNRPK